MRTRFSGTHPHTIAAMVGEVSLSASYFALMYGGLVGDGERGWGDFGGALDVADRRLVDLSWPKWSERCFTPSRALIEERRCFLHRLTDRLSLVSTGRRHWLVLLGADRAGRV